MARVCLLVIILPPPTPAERAIICTGNDYIFNLIPETVFSFFSFYWRATTTWSVCGRSGRRLVVSICGIAQWLSVDSFSQPVPLLQSLGGLLKMTMTIRTYKCWTVSVALPEGMVLGLEILPSVGRFMLGWSIINSSAVALRSDQMHSWWVNLIRGWEAPLYSTYVLKSLIKYSGIGVFS